MKKSMWFVCILSMSITLAGTVFAEDENKPNLPWKKAYLDLGWFIADTDSGFRIGEGNLGLGVSIDVEEFLGLDSTNDSFRLEGGWRFTENKRHKLQLGWFGFRRDSTTTVGSTITIPPELGGGTIGPGTVSSEFNFDVIRLKYEYSIVLDDRLDLNVGGGLFVMPIEFGVAASVGGVGGRKLEEDITAPLPALAIGFDFAITPKWFIRQQLEFFYLSIGDFEGSLVGTSLALEYLPWKHVGFGLGFDAFRVDVEANGSDWPGIDFKGQVEFRYAGVQLYLKVF